MTLGDELQGNINRFFWYYSQTVYLAETDDTKRRKTVHQSVNKKLASKSYFLLDDLFKLRHKKR